ncbi:hypothetical protein NA57DRAFT_26310, partial [Rhizodiscina lignyota]
KGPLRLLDLPVDILREIINQLPHTNDLTSLALCHSILHSLTIPCIYSRFDIVWPDTNTQTEPRTGVDALTYGLATLVMHEEVFGEAPWQRARAVEPQTNNDSKHPYPLKRRRRGNYYAQYTKKFSLGNGPLEYVQEYLITKEGGKMLGTLVALAVARMRNLETFVWDMPTGVLRDVWLALSSLADRDDGQDCRLERIWIRWHDNSQLDMLNAVPPPPTLPLNNIAPQNGAHGSGIANPQPAVIVQAASQFLVSHVMERVEHPTFSVLPPLKSLSVLDIDELPYLDEMSVLIARSQHRLRELRIGIAGQAEDREWVQVWEGESLQQVDYTSDGDFQPKISNSRLGGILGILVGRVYNMRNNSNTAKPSTRIPRSPDEIRPLRPSSEIFADAVSQQLPESSSSADSDESNAASQSNFTPKAAVYPNTPAQKAIPLRTLRSTPREARLRGPYLDGKLKLEILELERVPLCVSILQHAIDWSILSSLTLLNCQNHDQLWKSLRHIYSPLKPPKSHMSPLNAASPYSTPRRTSVPRCTEYSLNLKKIHTNTASLSLINFIKDTLPPNSLEVFFLQESRVPASTTVPIEAIYRGVVRRHRTSLKKLMIDSSDPRGSTDYSTTNARWRRWMLNREIITFITSGRMPVLRELGFTIDYKDWHFFLQHLPSIPHVRSIYIPHVADHPHGSNSDPRELALQIVDIVALRPDIELCYVGIASKCFEILENKSHNYDLRNNSPDGGNSNDGGPGNEPLILDEEDDDADPGEDDDEEDEMGIGGIQTADDDVTQSESEEEFQDDDDDEEFGSDAEEDGIGRDRGPKLRLREILFYDDKVAVFRARHGRL